MSTPPFQKPSKADWLAKVEKDLKGKDLESLNFTVAGNTYSPFHHLSDAPVAHPPVAGMPSGHRLVGIEITVGDDYKGANAIALDALAKGADLLLFRIRSIETLTKANRKILLKGILTDIVTIIFAEPLYKYPGAPLLLQQGQDYHIDALAGDIAAGLYSAMESYVEDGVKNPTFHVRSRPNYLRTIAELRALRLCWSRISEACGGRSNCTVIGHVAHPPESDANQNKIVATTSAMSLIIGGANGLIVAASDGGAGTNFSRRVALNLQHILEYESHLAGLPDPAAGSYYLEQLTDDIAAKLWQKFQHLTTDSSFNI
ncbi:methylmalonyl-CoA mutase family protein [Lewinella sp. 4G2]|uniref:methylmalonyl-CoA mutase family protein n=1 Tax=Lewinella sp. 4G2 TaxID=1803372 RepID=UPI0007B4767B|nr:methylmalonyl-CoA mutase family protein [Lewinella sp. 4G2]OAV46136.1 hypothetical protein A3850_017910 [Lewinella sp. 4G2]